MASSRSSSRGDVTTHLPQVETRGEPTVIRTCMERLKVCVVIFITPEWLEDYTPGRGKIVPHNFWARFWLLSCTDRISVLKLSLMVELSILCSHCHPNRRTCMSKSFETSEKDQVHLTLKTAITNEFPNQKSWIRCMSDDYVNTIYRECLRGKSVPMPVKGLNCVRVF